MAMDDDNDESIKPEAKSFVSRLKYFENNISSSTEDLSNRRYSVVPVKCRQVKQNRLSYSHLENSSTSSIHDVENRPVKPIHLKGLISPENGLKSSAQSSSMYIVPPVPPRKSVLGPAENDEKRRCTIRSWSLRKKNACMPTLFQNQSLFNISDLDRQTPSYSSISKEAFYSRTMSMTKTGSMVSLFDEDVLNSTIVDYSIDWKAIFDKISEKTSNDIEEELISYFHNSQIDLKIFPINCLHWFMTFDDMLEMVCSEVLTTELQIDFSAEILKIPTKVIDIDYGLNSYDVAKLIRCNVKNLEEMVVEYSERKSNLGDTLTQLKESLGKYLVRPDNLTKVHREIDNICIKFQRLSDVLILIITSISTWKLIKDFPMLYEHKSCETTTLKTCESMLCEFRDSQKKLEQQIMKLFKQFNEDNCSDVLRLFDQMFSENLEVSICLTIFDDKLRKGNQMLTVLANSSIKVTKEEQFV